MHDRRKQRAWSYLRDRDHEPRPKLGVAPLHLYFPLLLVLPR